MARFEIKYEMALLQRTLLFIAVLLFGLTGSSCVMIQGDHLKTFESKPGVVGGTYSLLLYGCRYPADLENVAILDKEGDPYTIEIYAPAFRYTVKTGLSADEALKEAGQFVTCGLDYQQSQFSTILDPAGNVAGYEIRPLYWPIRYGRYNVLDIQYFSKGKKITVYIRLDPAIEKELTNDGDRDNRGGK